MRNIIQFSGGKDSTAMLIGLIERDIYFDEVIFFDTGWEFDSVYRNIEQWQTWLVNRGIPFTILTPKANFDYLAFEKVVNKRDGSFGKGYSWCGGVCRWGTTEKLKALERYCKGHIELVGIAIDETDRLIKSRNGTKQYPLAEWGITEKAALETCYKNGVNYIEDGHVLYDAINKLRQVQNIRLYDVLDRGSCFCCGNKNLKELKGVFKNLPQYWERLKAMQNCTDRLYKKVGLQALEHRFESELSKEALI